MKTKITFLKQIAFLCCLFIFSIFNDRLYSQIIYTDIIPDATPSATYPLDLNNDNIDDFVIVGGDTKILCSPQNSNAYSGDFVGGEYLPWALSSSTNICSSLATWYGSGNSGTMVSGISGGYWVGATNKYLALKLIVGTNTYYGWARLDFVTGSFTVKDYAYESTPNTCIQTGQTAVGINENTGKHVFSIFPNPFISNTTIQTIDNLKNASLTICNSYGQTVKQVKNISGQTISLSRDNFPCGMYFVRLTEENKIIAVEKLIITD
jgi:Secretion system C-terminal sorting domain